MRTYARVYQLEDGTCVGEIDVPRTDDDTPIPVQATGPDGAAALMRAADLADTLLQDPLLAAIIPPQAHLAIGATKQLAAAASAGGGILRSLWKSIRGPGKKRLAKALMRTTPTVRLSTGDIGATVVRDHRTNRPRRPSRTIQIRAPQQPQYPGYPQYPQGYPQYPQYPPYDPYAAYGGYYPQAPQYPQYDPYAAYYGQQYADPYAAYYGQQPAGYGYDPTAWQYDQNALENIFNQ